MEHILYWLWLTTRRNISGARMRYLLESFSSVEEIYFTKSFNNIYGLADDARASLLDKDLSGAKKILEKCEKLRIKIICYDNESYPEILKNISNPPPVLYVQGVIPDMDEILTIGVVGTRRFSEYGRLVTERICASLAREGVITISGLARGIDTMAARTTLNAGSVTVAVVGNGLDIMYPSENQELIRAICERGCVITEFPPGTPPRQQNFPQRNRIIAGLSRGVLVTEAPKKSGALITAGYALDSGRDVFAVPRGITDTEYLGTNMLIQQGAKLVNSADDILCEYPYAERIIPTERKYEIRSPEKEKTAEKNTPKKNTSQRNAPEMDDKRYEELNDKEKSVIKLLKESDMQVDEISRQLDIQISEINIMLTLLEVKGLVKKLPGSSYQLKL